MGLIAGSSPGSGFAAPQSPDCGSPLPLQQRGMVFIKPMSPVPAQPPAATQPVALISVQQVTGETDL